MAKKMITELTPEQEALLEVYRNKGLKIGLDTSPCDRTKAEHWLKEAYKQVDLVPPDKIIWSLSPQGCLEQYRKYTGKSKKESREEIQNFCYGSHDSSWLQFYNYFLEVFNLDCCKPLIPLIELSRHCGWYLPYDEVIFVSEKPEEIHMENERLHKDLSPAIKFSDGFCVYALGGVRMKEEYVMTPAEKMDPKTILNEQNVDVRAQLLKKVGMEKLAKYGKSIHKMNDEYELLDMSGILEGTSYAPYLLMRNASMPGIYHLEGVHPDCKTCEHAFNWRVGRPLDAPLDDLLFKT